jgi:hypothetical protein
MTVFIATLKFMKSNSREQSARIYTVAIVRDSDGEPLKLICAATIQLVAGVGGGCPCSL